VSELARVLEVSESAVSQHLKILKEAGLLTGEKRGYYMHYDIDRKKLRGLAHEIEGMANLERQTCAGSRVWTAIADRAANPVRMR
jgi:ArsR family transcriptional regulator